MNHNLLVLTLALTSASGLLGKNASASASASATARADDPAHRAHPETDTKAGEADAKTAATQPATTEDFSRPPLQGSQCPLQLEACAKLYEDGNVCQHLRGQVVAVVNQRHNKLFPGPFPGGVSGAIKVRYPVFYTREIPLTNIWAGLEQHPNFPKDIAHLVHAYARERIMDCNIVVVDPATPYGERSFLGRFNLDTQEITTDGKQIDGIIATCKATCRANAQPGDHRNELYTLCPQNIKRGVPCEHLKQSLIQRFRYLSPHAVCFAPNARYTIIDSRLSGLDEATYSSQAKMRALVRDTVTGKIYECMCTLTCSPLFTAHETTKTKLD